MIDITPRIPRGQPVILSYGPGRFQLQDQEIRGAVAILGEEARPWPEPYPKLDMALLEALGLSEGRALPSGSLVLIGTGDARTAPPPAFETQVQKLGAGLEVMGTPAACRTCQILVSEQRPLTALFMPITGAVCTGAV